MKLQPGRAKCRIAGCPNQVDEGYGRMCGGCSMSVARLVGRDDLPTLLVKVVSKHQIELGRLRLALSTGSKDGQMKCSIISCDRPADKHRTHCARHHNKIRRWVGRIEGRVGGSRSGWQAEAEFAQVLVEALGMHARGCKGFKPQKRFNSFERSEV